MRFLRFILREVLLRGIVFTCAGTFGLVCLYLRSIGAPPEDYAAALRTFGRFVSGSSAFSAEQVGFSTKAIITSAAAVTFPLALAALCLTTLLALASSATRVSARYRDASGGAGRVGRVAWGAFATLLGSSLASTPLFVGLWLLYGLFGMSPPPIAIALVLVLVGGIGWDAARFLSDDMGRRSDATYAMVYGMLGVPAGRILPLPGTMTGYLFMGSAPRFIPYLAGKVPAIIGGITIAEMVFSFPGLGRTLLESLLLRNDQRLIASVFVLLAVNACVTLLVKAILFVLYPRSYEKAL